MQISTLGRCGEGKVAIHLARARFDGRRTFRSSSKSKTYSPPLPFALPRPACHVATSAPLPLCCIPWRAAPLRISGNVGINSFSVARGLSAHHLSPNAAILLLPLPKASIAVHLARGCHVSRPRRKFTVSGVESVKIRRSRLSARPEASDCRLQRIKSGHPIADNAAKSSGVGEPRSLTMSESCSIGVSPVKHGSLWISSANTRPADHMSTAGV